MDKEYSITIDGEAVTFEFKDSLIHAEGEHTGNIDAIITTKPPLPQNLLLDELHIKVPGTDEYLYIYGYGAVENSLKATFNSSVLVDTEKLPEMVEVYWGANGDKFIGEMCCQPYSETAESELSEEIEDIDTPDESNKTPKMEASAKEKVNEKQEEIIPVKKIASINKLILIGAVAFIIVVVSFLLL
jgi:hypothetical protein